MRIKITEDIYKFLNEAIPYNDVKSYLNIDRTDAIKAISQIWPKLEAIANSKSKRGDRLYFDVKGEDVSDNAVQPKSSVKEEINDLFLKYGYTIIDYKKGLAGKIDGGGEIRIGKLLEILIKKYGNNLKTYLRNYEKDSTRNSIKEKARYIVFSKHPYDIAGMSTGRGWTSCMNLYDGEKKAYVSMDVKEGSFVAYLINKDDLNINKPQARVSVKPFFDKNSNVYYGIERRGYGTYPEYFLNEVKKIVEGVQSNVFGIFNFKKGVHCDTVLEPEQRRIDKRSFVGFLKSNNIYYNIKWEDDIYVGDNLIIDNELINSISGKLYGFLPKFLSVEKNLKVFDVGRLHFLDFGLDYLRVREDFYVAGADVKLPNKIYVGGDFTLRCDDVVNIPDFCEVDGNLDIRESNIEKLPKDLEVGGIVFCKNLFKEKWTEEYPHITFY